MRLREGYLTLRFSLEVLAEIFTLLVRTGISEVNSKQKKIFRMNHKGAGRKQAIGCQSSAPALLQS